jgi:hypothetical protein
MTPDRIYAMTLDLIEKGYINREALERYLYKSITGGDHEDADNS